MNELPSSLVPAVFLSLAMPCAGAEGAAPSIVSTYPSNGDAAVPATVTEIVVTFDQDMDPGGFSFMGGGPTFPEVTGNPSWRNARECVLPVRLVSSRPYTIGINSATKGNFKNRKGVSATPLVLRFTTIAEGAPVSKDVQAESIRQLREALESRYSHKRVHAVDWEKVWRTFETRLTSATSAREFAVVAGEMLAATKDPHIWLVEGGEIVPAFRPSMRPNVNAERLPDLIDGWTFKHPMVAFGMAAPDTGYIAIHSWEKKHAPELLESAFAVLAGLRDVPSLIIDVRLNNGGDETMARAFAGCFVPDRALYARHQTLDPESPDGFSPPVERWIEPNPDHPPYEGRVAVLMGPANMSSAEAFLLMMRQAPKCQLIGARSYGASGNPQPHALANGVTVYLPSWRAMLPDGTDLETKGIRPDVEVPAGAEGQEKRDRVMEKAVEWLRASK